MTGAGQAHGVHCALLAQEGATVVALDLNLEAAQSPDGLGGYIARSLTGDSAAVRRWSMRQGYWPCRCAGSTTLALVLSMRFRHS